MASSSSEREAAINVAKLAEQAKRFDEMVEALKIVAKMDAELTANMRNMLTVAYKNVIGSRRASWRILSSIVKKEESRGHELNAKRVKEYRQKVETEITKICGDLMSIIDDHPIPSGTSGESTVFNFKMKGDCYRYLSELKTEDERKELANQSLEAYQKATMIAEAELPRTNPIRLSLALNYSVLYYEIFDLPERACHLAQKAFDEAIPDLGSLDEETYEESSLIMDLLRSNITIWASDMKDADEKAAKKAEGEGAGAE